MTAEKTDTVSNASLREALLNAGLIRKIVSKNGLEYEVTGLGRQLIDDYERLEYKSDVGRVFSSVTAGSFSEYDVIECLRNLVIRKELSPETQVTMHVSIVIPTLNEARGVANLLEKIPDCMVEMPEIIVVDSSTDETAFVAANLGAKVLNQKGAGKGDAIRQAFSSKYDGNIIVMMDADGSNRPEEIPRLLEAIIKGADVAKASRFLKGGGSTDISRIRKIGNKLFVSLVNLRWSAGYTDICYGFLAFKKDALEKLAPLLESKHFQIETEICIKALKLGLKVVEVPSLELERLHGTSKLRGIQDSIRISRTIIREMF